MLVRILKSTPQHESNRTSTRVNSTVQSPTCPPSSRRAPNYDFSVNSKKLRAVDASLVAPGGSRTSDLFPLSERRREGCPKDGRGWDGGFLVTDETGVVGGPSRTKVGRRSGRETTGVHSGVGDPRSKGWRRVFPDLVSQDCRTPSTSHRPSVRRLRVSETSPTTPRDRIWKPLP